MLTGVGVNCLSLGMYYTKKRKTIVGSSYIKTRLKNYKYKNICLLYKHIEIEPGANNRYAYVIRYFLKTENKEISIGEGEHKGYDKLKEFITKDYINRVQLRRLLSEVLNQPIEEKETHETK